LTVIFYKNETLFPSSGKAGAGSRLSNTSSTKQATTAAAGTNKGGKTANAPFVPQPESKLNE